MPIRRAAAAAPSEEKAPSVAAEKEADAASEESPPADEEQTAAAASPAEDEEGGGGSGENAEDEGAAGDRKEPDGSAEVKDEKDEKEMKDGYKFEKTKAKKVKRTIPAWASVTSNKKIPVTNFAGTQNKVDNVLVEAIASCTDRSGISFQSVMKYILKNYPGMELSKKKFLIKKAMKKHLEKGTIKQLKGKGLSGTFAIGKQPPPSKKGGQKQESLGDALPLIITRLCEPKEASYNLIKKYLEQHFPSLNIENRPDVLKTALVKAVEKGLLEQITGKGARGTFQLKRARKDGTLKGSTMEEAITVAITAMNEPKTCSTTSLRKYLLDSNKDMRENQLVATLRRTLTKCKVLGWMEQITGHGFTGTYQLLFPFYPSPNTLYPDKFKEAPKKPVKRRKTSDSSDEEEEEEEEEETEEEESEDEAPPRRRKSQKKPPRKAQRPPPAKKSPSAARSKAKGRALAKKSPAKKAAAPTKRPAKKGAKKGPAAAPKATPVKKGAPSRKPKVPSVKKLAKRGSRKPVYRESSPEVEEEEEEETTRTPSKRSKSEAATPAEPKAAKETPKRGSKRSKQEEPVPEEPPAKKQPAKGGAKRGASEATPAKAPAKKGPKSSKQSARKSKRGKN